jgi:2-desacetyl-2-hydroxyethyl bacteriochlorophyllide A dehydrogenase
MKALVYVGPRQVEYHEVEAPLAGDDQCIVEVEYCGICGSDMHAWAGHDDRRPAPLVLGHEVVGTALTGPYANKRVAINPLVACGECAHCASGRENLCAHRQIISMPPRAGGFAEQVIIPPANLLKIPDNAAAEKAALIEPLSCGYHAVRLAENALPKSVEDAKCLVFGGGAIGLGAALVLASKNAKEIWLAETNPVRRKVIEQAGNFRVFDPVAQDGPENVDLVVDGVGIDATRKAASAFVSPGGVIAHIGLGAGNGGLDIRRMTLQEITFIGTYTYTSNDFQKTAELVFDGSLGSLDWPEIRPLKDGAGAFKDISTGRAAAPKIILKP